MKNIIENNKLIAEFIGTESLKELLSDKNGLINIDKDIYEQCKFHSDWNWLMKVVEKIDTLADEENKGEFFFEVYKDSVTIFSNGNYVNSLVEVEGQGSRLNNVYQACVEFINWYNNSSLDGTKEVRDTSDMRDKVLKAIMERYAGLVNLKGAMWEDEDTVLVNLCADLNDEFTETEVLLVIVDLFK